MWLYLYKSGKPAALFHLRQAWEYKKPCAIIKMMNEFMPKVCVRQFFLRDVKCRRPVRHCHNLCVMVGQGKACFDK